MTVFLDARRPPVLRRHLLPARRPHGHARLRRPAATPSTTRGATGATSSLEQAEQLTEAHRAAARASASRAAGDAARHRGARPAPYRALPAQFDAACGGFGGAPKFPQAMTPRRSCCAPRRAATRRDDARAWSPRRSTPWPRAASTTTSAAASPATRSTRTGSCPTSRRCSTTRRCSRARTCTPGRSPATPRYRAGASRRRSTTCCATCATPTAASSPPRTPTPRASKGKFYVWSLDEIEALLGDDAARGRPSTGTASPPAGNFEDPHIRLPRQHPARGRPADDRPDVDRRPVPRLFAAREQRVRPGLDDKVLLGWNALFLRSLAEAAAALGRDRLDGRGARQRASSCCASCAATTAACCGRGRTGAPTCSPTPRTTPRCSRRLLTLAELRRRRAGSPRRGPSPTSCVALFADDERGGVLHHRRRRRSADRPAQGLPGQRHAVGELARRRRRCCGWLRSPATPTRPRAPSAGSRRWRRWSGEHPTAFAFLLEALERARPPAARGRGGRRAPAIRREAHWSTCSAGGCCRRRYGSPPHPASAPSSRRSSPSAAERDGRATAYVCQRFACQLPVTDADALRDQLDHVTATRR